MNRVWLAVAALACSSSTGLAFGQVSAAGSTLLIPVVASTSTYTTELIVKDASGTARSVTMEFYEAETSSTPGPKACAAISLSPWEGKTVTLAAQCPLAPGSHHGFVILRDASVPATKRFYAFSRTVNFNGIGFAVDGIPIGHIGGGEGYAEVIGVKKQTATQSTPEYQTNCFVGSLDDAVNYTIDVFAGSPYSISGSLQPYQMRRYLDIYASAGVPPGNRSNTTIGFQKTGGTEAATLLAFCTVQDNTFFGADFRIAKNQHGADPTRMRNLCWAAQWSGNSCTDTLQSWAPSIPNAVTKQRTLMHLYAPDTVVCSLVGSRKNDLELRLVRFGPSFAVVAGGNDQQSFTFNTGPRSAITSGWHTDHQLEVGFREGGNATFPIQYGVSCESGNGTYLNGPMFAVSDDF